MDRTRISELPLNGRNVLQLQQLVPGAVFAGSGDQFGNTPSFQVNGGVLFSNSYTLDGGEHIDSFFNSAITFPNPDAIEEFSIQTSSYSAEYGRNRGATVNAVTRSGKSRRIQFRSEFFNMFNNVNLGLPVASVTAGAFGRILSTTTPPRVIEFGLKFQF